MDARYLILDDLNTRNSQNVIEHRESSIEYHVLQAQSASNRTTVTRDL